MAELARQACAERFRPRSILVTGGAGFIGSHTVRKLLLEHFAVSVPGLGEDGADGASPTGAAPTGAAAAPRPKAEEVADGAVASAARTPDQDPDADTLVASGDSGDSGEAGGKAGGEAASSASLTGALSPGPAVKLVVLDNLSYCASMQNLSDVLELPNFKFIKGDITSSDLVTYVMEVEEIDCVLHFAAETHVDLSFGNSFAFTKTNVLGTHVLLEAAKNRGAALRRFIHVSTDEVYGESKGADHFHEESMLEPSNPYAATKAAAEFLCKAYHRSFNVPVVITRGNNVFGPNQYPEKLIPKFVHQMMRGLPLTIHGDGSTRRNMLFVTDVADAFASVLDFAQPGQTINIGGAHERSVLDIAEAVLAHFGRSGPDHAARYMRFVEDRNYNDTRYNIDNSRLRELGWEQKVGFDEGLRRTVEWYAANALHWGSIEHALAAHPRPFGDYASHEPPSRKHSV